MIVGTSASPKIELTASTVDGFRAGMRRASGGLSINPSNEVLAALAPGTTLALAYDLRSRETLLVGGPTGWLRDGQTTSVCTRYEGPAVHRFVAEP